MAQSAEGHLSTAIPGAVSGLRSAAGAVQTANIGGFLDALLPRNCSLGSKKFCFGFDSHSICGDLPLDISVLLPASQGTTASFEQALKPFKLLQSCVAEITPGYIEATAIAGLVLLFVLTGLLAYLAMNTKFALFMSRLNPCQALPLRIWICMSSLLSLIPFLLPVGVLSVAKAKIGGIGPPVAEMKMGGSVSSL